MVERAIEVHLEELRKPLQQAATVTSTPLLRDAIEMLQSCLDEKLRTMRDMRLSAGQAHTHELELEAQISLSRGVSLRRQLSLEEATGVVSGTLTAHRERLAAKESRRQRADATAASVMEKSNLAWIALDDGFVPLARAVQDLRVGVQAAEQRIALQAGKQKPLAVSGMTEVAELQRRKSEYEETLLRLRHGGADIDVAVYGPSADADIDEQHKQQRDLQEQASSLRIQKARLVERIAALR